MPKGTAPNTTTTRQPLRVPQSTPIKSPFIETSSPKQGKSGSGSGKKGSR
jgi:hypothetical protein